MGDDGARLLKTQQRQTFRAQAVKITAMRNEGERSGSGSGGRTGRKVSGLHGGLLFRFRGARNVPPRSSDVKARKRAVARTPRMLARMTLPSWLPALALLAALSTAAVGAEPRILIFGEQHDQPDHQRQVAAEVTRAAATGRLAAVVLEMADAGHDTQGLPRDADELRMRQSLAWTGWPWEVYSGVVMAAVRAGVPVAGGNLPRAAVRPAMADTSLDTLIGAAPREALLQAVRAGHCGLLPASQEPGMLRVQIARDRSMAQTVEARLASAAPDQQVLLLTGAMHASRDRGVPLHLTPEARVVIFGERADELSADEHRAAASVERPDPCEGLKKQLAAQRAASAP